ncbi:olfactory receptor 51H1-like [Podarcis lilfordi]|uniref:Olfactory receptor 51H1-like n=1 Tax=Podarcis lilfordi TaxID=74358 RepID=A0AA35P308_9SAUR|nr:olfactory receptor 51H1-like [Podarcis lilfordi]
MSSITSSNETLVSHQTFVLIGIPGMQEKNSWVAFPLFVLYALTLLGNITILYIIKTNQSLHEPMYFFLSMLACSDLGLCFSTMPTILSVYWFDSGEIPLNGCISQMFFIHALQGIESGILVAMAFDRLIAIRDPLRSNVLSHSYCLHQDAMKLACADIKVNIFYGLIIAVCTLGTDIVIILASYVMILKTVLSIASHEECFKALNTCVAHVSAILIFYVPMIGIAVVHRYGKHLSPIVHMLMANTFVMVPPLLNPVVYCVKTQQIRQRLLIISGWGCKKDLRFKVSSKTSKRRVMCTVLLDALVILVSYILILKTVLSIASRKECLKALNTCVAHISAILIFYVPMIGITVVHRYGKHLSPIVHMLMANIFVAVPPLLNPFVYSVNTPQIRQRICNILQLKRTRG